MRNSRPTPEKLSCAYMSPGNPKRDPTVCQFRQARDFYTFEGRTWCHFHLPAIGTSGELSPKVSWSEDKIGRFNDEVLGSIRAVREMGDHAVDFSGVVFPGTIQFGWWHDSKEKFPYLWFVEAVFLGDADFSNIDFIGEVDFENAVFYKYARFNHSSFGGYTRFVGTAFLGHAQFDGSTFHDIADFAGFYVSRGDDPKETFRTPHRPTVPGDFWSTAVFDDAQFLGCARFTNRNFRHITSFASVIFNVAPEFENCELHESINFEGAKFLDTGSDGAVQSYRTLKRAMEAIRARRFEGIFYALEQRSLRRTGADSLVNRSISAIYDGLSDYGQSCIRPFFIWLVTQTIFSIVYATIAAKGLVILPKVDWSQAVAFAMAQSLRPFAIWATNYAPPQWAQESWLMVRVIGTVNSLISSLLWGLSILALRWRFRR